MVGLVAALVLTGCASSAKRDLAPADPAAIESFELSGRVSVKVKAENKGYPGKIRWQHQGAMEDLWIYTPLGNLVAHLEQDENTAAITTAEGEEYRAGTLAFLARDVLGYDLPIDALQYWVRGLEWPKGRTSRVVKDDKGRLAVLAQDHWEVSYQAWGDHDGLPSKMIVENEEMKLSLVIDQWRLRDLGEGESK